MALPHPLPEPLAELVARRFRVIGEPMRIRILDRLRDGEATVQELTEALQSSQQNVSKHLAVLHGAGILSRRKQGTFAWYAIADESVLGLCERVCGGLQRQFSELAQLVGCRAPRRLHLRVRTLEGLLQVPRAPARPLPARQTSHCEPCR